MGRLEPRISLCFHCKILLLPLHHNICPPEHLTGATQKGISTLYWTWMLATFLPVIFILFFYVSFHIFRYFCLSSNTTHSYKKGPAVAFSTGVHYLSAHHQKLSCKGREFGLNMLSKYLHEKQENKIHQFNSILLFVLWACF